ncbi:hypothetical protein ACIA74_34170 [Streptomyces sp. NPDC051658]|uniref:hypothetical protein n=1 Tax=unclassified Streptomyces TaxID=2593676 RepID=UPI0037AEDDB1|nr:hypothetical protein OG520_33390 [Streptomyces sp. NBC_00984]
MGGGRFTGTGSASTRAERCRPAALRSADAGSSARPESRRSADTALRESLAGLTNPHPFKRCAELAASGPVAAARHTLRSPARRIQHLPKKSDVGAVNDAGSEDEPVPGGGEDGGEAGSRRR